MLHSPFVADIWLLGIELERLVCFTVNLQGKNCIYNFIKPQMFHHYSHTIILAWGKAVHYKRRGFEGDLCHWLHFMSQHTSFHCWTNLQLLQMIVGSSDKTNVVLLLDTSIIWSWILRHQWQLVNKRLFWFCVMIFTRLDDCMVL